jgi:hypothetical protein
MQTEVMEPETKSLLLYAPEGYLTELQDTEGAVEPAEQAAFDLELAQALKATARTENVGQFILECEAQAEFCKAEARRIGEQAKRFERMADRVRERVLYYIMSRGIDAVGKFMKLRGKTLTFSARSNPPSVEIIDAEAVPARFKTVKVEMPLEQWYQLVEAHPDETAGALKSIDIDKRMLKEAIGRGEDVAGADLLIGRYSLTVR